MNQQNESPLAALPHAADPAAAGRTLARWHALASNAPPGPADPEAAAGDALLRGIFGSSPYLTELLFAEPDLWHRFRATGPDQVAEALRAERAVLPVDNRQAVMTGWRRAKRRLALLCALADLAGQWPLAKVTGALSDFADAATQAALGFALREAAKRGELALADPTAPQARSGFIVLGMGKLGAGELNYSSDIDLIVLFDPERFRPTGRDGAMALAVRLTRTLVYLLDHRTPAGYVFRTDLRLRPHPPGQPLALSVDDAELYYERFGQNWERAALIKARVIAGDAVAGEAFLQRLRPFLWRRHLDYAAIRDIHSIKRQINAYRGHGAIRIEGHDLKVGRGGIREIEFFVQTQQLILGGKVPELRLRGTCAALDALVRARWLAAETAAELKTAYEFLRHCEHRLQMIADKQTQSLPSQPEQLARFAAFMGYAEPARFSQALLVQLEQVERHYAALFESSLDLGAGGALVFTGTDDDPDTLATLARLGFKRPPAMAARIRAWHHGHIRATRTARARELLTELMPQLLRELAEQPDPDDAFERFDGLMQGLPAGVQLFSLMRANPRLLRLIADLVGAAPRLASHLSGHLGLFEAMLAPDFFEPVPDAARLEAELTAALRRAGDQQDLLDAARRFAQSREFQIGVQVLLGLLDGDAAGPALSAIATVVIQGLLAPMQAALAAQHGAVPGGSFVVVALGKLGSEELTIGSDLDLIFVYDAPTAARSEGARPLPAATYYARLGQRLVSALTAPTPEGRLYEIDTRLRPSGNLGPVACSLENFERYQMGTAETWEHQALTRARVIAGDPSLGQRVEAIIQRALCQVRPEAELRQAVAGMRARIFKEHGSADPWRVKHVRGGLVEAEFLAQYLQLRHAASQPAILTRSTTESFERAAALGLLEPEAARLLVQAVRLYRRIQAVLRLSVQGFEPAAAPKGLREVLVGAVQFDPEIARPGLDFAAVEEILRARQKAVAALFNRLCPQPIDPTGEPPGISGGTS